MTVLPNGVRLIIRATKAAPTVSIVAMNLGGVRLEDAREAGEASLAASLLTRGTTGRSAEQISNIVDDLGGSLNGFSGYNSCGIESNWLADDWKSGLNLVAESFLKPSFPQSEFQNLKAQTLSALASQDDDPMSAASRLMRRLYFGNHPYARSPLGEIETVKKLTRADVQRYWNSISDPKNTVIAVSGDIDADQIQKSATYLFGRFKATTLAPFAPPAITPPPSFTSRTVEKPGITQSVLWYAFPSISITDPDRYAVDVLDAAMSGANLPGGRLHERLRDNQLVYVVHAFDSPAIGGGIFIIYAGTTRENRAQAQAIIDEELARIQQEEISDAELERAKSMSISAHAIDLQSNSAQARQAASDELFGLGYGDSANYTAKINAITKADVLRAAQKYLDKSQSALAIVEPSAK